MSMLVSTSTLPLPTIIPLSPDPSQCLLVRAGESILCVNCKRPLAIAIIDCFEGLTGQNLSLTEDGIRKENALLCRHCSPCGVGGALPPCLGPPVWFVKLVKSPRLLIQSIDLNGNRWIGWRELGGE